MITAAQASAFFFRYDSFGLRRAGGLGDLGAAQWLAGLMGELKRGEVRSIDVPFERFVPGEAYLQAHAGRIDGLPLFDGGLTGPEGVSGLMGSLGSDAPIGFALMEPSMASLPGNAFARERRASRHLAMVVALTTREGGLAPLNAHDLDRPFGPPVLQIAGRDAERVEGLLRSAEVVRVMVTGHRESSISRNVRVELSGQGPPLLILTPRTSWWTSTAERAGGIFAWAEALRALAQSESCRAPVIGLATCCHELGHIGAHQAFAAEPSLANESSLVIHLGANLGTATEPTLTVRSNVEGLADQMSAALMREGYPKDAIKAVTGGKAGGEAHEIEQRGGRYLSLIGTNPWFHAPEDRWPKTIDLERATAIARAVAEVALAHQSAR
jgi:hypothetical protein